MPPPPQSSLQRQYAPPSDGSAPKRRPTQGVRTTAPTARERAGASHEAVVSDFLAALRLITFSGVGLTLALTHQIPGTWVFWGTAAAAVPGALHFLAPFVRAGKP